MSSRTVIVVKVGLPAILSLNSAVVWPKDNLNIVRLVLTTSTIAPAQMYAFHSLSLSCKYSPQALDKILS